MKYGKFHFRQGKGTFRYANNAPHEHLLLVRRGTANFARELNNLMDGDLDEPSRRAGLSRRIIICSVSYNARALANSMKYVRAEKEALLPPSQTIDEDINRGATLPARALRHLFYHTAKHLEVEWRDLRWDNWETNLRLSDGSLCSVRNTPAERANELWSAAADLSKQYP